MCCSFVCLLCPRFWLSGRQESKREEGKRVEGGGTVRIVRQRVASLISFSRLSLSLPPPSSLLHSPSAPRAHVRTCVACFRVNSRRTGTASDDDDVLPHRLVNILCSVSSSRSRSFAFRIPITQLRALRQSLSLSLSLFHSYTTHTHSLLLSLSLSTRNLSLATPFALVTLRRKGNLG